MNLGKKIILGLLVIIVFQEAIAKGKQIDMDSTSVKFEWNFYETTFTECGMPPDVTNQIDEMAEFVSKFPNDTFLVVGHTDSRGSDEFNLKLSTIKAKYIRTLLIERGIDPGRIIAFGCGKKELKIPNAETELEHEQNRRVTLEFYIPQDVKKIKKKRKTR